MKANELRLGNLILNDRIINTIAGINTNSVHLRTPQGNYIDASVELIKPVLLTEEWAIKYGFIKQEWQGYNPAGYCDYVLNDVIRLERREVFSFNCYGHPYDEGVESNGFSFDVLYVHQLQNLHFALIGEELEIKK